MAFENVFAAVNVCVVSKCAVLADKFASGKIPVTSVVKSIPAFFIVTVPEFTSKLSELNEATPLLLVVANSPAIVIVVPVELVSIPSPPVIVKAADPAVSDTVVESSVVNATPVISPIGLQAESSLKYNA